MKPYWPQNWLRPPDCGDWDSCPFRPGGEERRMFGDPWAPSLPLKCFCDFQVAGSVVSPLLPCPLPSCPALPGLWATGQG